jgi:hypothetical protein
VSLQEVTARIEQLQTQLAAFAPAQTNGVSGAQFAQQMSALTDGTQTATSTGVGSKGAAVVADARKYLGVPYVWGGTDPATGLDCSGLVQRVYKDMGYDLPRVSYQQAEAGRAVEGGLANAQPGDILAFGSPVHHVAIYIGDNQMIEAPRPGKNVQVSSVYETPTAIRRILPEDAGVASVSGISGRVAAGTPYAGLFEAASQKYGVSSNLLAAVARQESGFNPRATSPAGAQGLMQLMPATADGLGVKNPYDPAQAVDGAARLLSGLLDRFGSTELALAAYNAGPGAGLRYDRVPPYPETQNYDRSILANMEAAA